MEPPLYRLDWLEIAGNGRTDRNGIQWILMEEQGFWDAPNTRTDVVERTNAHGSHVGSTYKGERVITMRGRAYCQDPRLLRTAWAHVTGIGADPDELVTLACDSPIGTQEAGVRMDGAIETQPIFPLLNTHAMEFSLQLLAPDPRKYSHDWRTMRAELPQSSSGDGLDFMDTGADMNTMTMGGMGMGGTTYKGLVFPLEFGASNASGFLWLVNSGTAPTCPVYTFHGPLTDPVLTATTDDGTHQIKYNGSLGANQYVEVDPSVPLVSLGGVSSRRHLLNPADFSGFYIPAAGVDQPGRLHVGLTHTGAVTTGGYVTAKFRDAWF